MINDTVEEVGATTQPWWTPDTMENHSDNSFPTRTQLSLSAYRISRRRQSFGGMPEMRMRSQGDIRSMLSKAALKSTNAMYNVRLCSLPFSIICRRAKIGLMVERPGNGHEASLLYTSSGSYCRDGSTEEDQCQKCSWYR